MASLYVILFGDDAGVHHLSAGSDSSAALSAAYALWDTDRASRGVAVLKWEPGRPFWESIYSQLGHYGRETIREEDFPALPEV